MIVHILKESQDQSLSILNRQYIFKRPPHMKSRDPFLIILLISFLFESKFIQAVVGVS